ncbi:MAG: DUF3450 domain-containing protein [Alphaproteobacteria bacterium]|nr:DUF3450 domain-containing protein [Alphaproteobacteria bacterium]
MTDHVFRSLRVLPAALLLAGALASPAAAQLEQNKGEIAGTTADGQKAQKEVDQLDDQRDDLEFKYRRTLLQLEGLQIYNDQQKRFIAKQEEEKVTLQNQIENIASLTRDLTPLMLDMVASVKKFVALDLPFLQKLRNERIARLDTVMADPQALAADRYRAILDMYKSENEYGRTIQAYTDEIEIDGEKRKVDFLKIGRVGFYYQTPDQQISAYFNPDTRSWERLSGSYNQAIRRGIKMALEVIPPDVMVLPVYVSTQSSEQPSK